MPFLPFRIPPHQLHVLSFKNQITKRKKNPKTKTTATTKTHTPHRKHTHAQHMHTPYRKHTRTTHTHTQTPQKTWSLFCII